MPCVALEEKNALAKQNAARRRVRRNAKRRSKVKTRRKKLKYDNERREKRRKRDIAQAEAAITAEEKAAAAEAKRAAREEKIEDRRRELAQRELARRELARRRLLAFIMRRRPDYKPGWVHKDICARLEKFSEAVVRGESPRLALFIPPRHGKSTIASQDFPAWHLGRNPAHEIISTSYAISLASDFSKIVQEIVRDEDFGTLFPGVGVLKNNESVERWLIAKDGKRTGGAFTSAGVGGPITGRGAHIGIIDDPVKNREDADSEAVRKTARDWYSSTFYTRLAPGAGILLIMTLWHEDDLGGHIVSEFEKAEKEAREANGVFPEDADAWEIVRYPAIATQDELYRKKGEALHPERYPLKALLRIKRALAPRDWAALYQQSPTIEEGAYFKREQFRGYTALPRYRDIIIAADLAISKQEQADWSVFYVCALDEDDDIYVIDERRARMDSLEIVNLIIELWKLWKPVEFGIEKGHISMAIGPLLSKIVMERRDCYGLLGVMTELPPGKRDKQLRARPLQGRMAQGKVRWPLDALWFPEAQNEFLAFGGGSKKDDRVDALAWIGQMLMTRKYSGRRRSEKKSWKDKLKHHHRGKRPKGAMAA